MEESQRTIYEFSAPLLDGRLMSLAELRGFEVLGFPCNQFGARKPGIFGSERIKWNFTKFLVDRKGNLTGRYAPNRGAKSPRRCNRRTSRK